MGLPYLWVAGGTVGRRRSCSRSLARRPPGGLRAPLSTSSRSMSRPSGPPIYITTAPLHHVCCQNFTRLLTHNLSIQRVSTLAGLNSLLMEMLFPKIGVIKLSSVVSTSGYKVVELITERNSVDQNCSRISIITQFKSCLKLTVQKLT